MSARLLFLAALAMPALAHAGNDDGVPLTVLVLDQAGDPILGAAVRNPLEAERHRVNSVTGAWSSNALYPQVGEPIFFEKGMDVSFEVTAPGYVSETVHYVVRRRRNVIEVTLGAIDLNDDVHKVEDPVIAFGRDTPIGGEPIEETEAE